MAVNNQTPEEYWKSVLGFLPEATYHSFQDSFGSAPNRQNFYKNQFGRIQNQFLGNLGKMAREGKTPSGSFVDFMEGFDFDADYRAQPRSVRGGSSGLFAPPVRFMNF